MHPPFQFPIHIRDDPFGVAVEEAETSGDDFITAVFVRGIVFGGRADRIGRSFCGLENFFEDNLILPIIAEVIGVTGLVLLHQKMIMQTFLYFREANLSGIKKEVGKGRRILLDKFDVDIFLADSVRFLDHKVMKMVALPIEQDLDDFVQFLE